MPKQESSIKLFESPSHFFASFLSAIAHQPPCDPRLAEAMSPNRERLRKMLETLEVRQRLLEGKDGEAVVAELEKRLYTKDPAAGKLTAK